MRAAGYPDALSTLRRTMARAALPAEEKLLDLGSVAVDAALAGGLARAALHEVAPAAPVHLAAACGFALTLAARAQKQCGSAQSSLLIQTDFARHEGGRLYGLGLHLLGLDPRHLLVLRVPRALDALFAMEEGLRCRALACVITELTEDAPAADLTATRRLSLAAREGGGLGVLLRHRASIAPSAAITRWSVAAAAGPRDNYGGIGATSFLLSLVKNRRGACGQWPLNWNHHDCIFVPATHSLGVAAPASDRPDRAAFAVAG